MADTTDQGAQETAYLPPHAPPTNHGHTTAAWTTTLLVFLGVLVVAGAMMASEVWIAWIGAAIIAVGVIAGKVLQMLGFGQQKVPTEGTR